jgi:hypothetical protein
MERISEISDDISNLQRIYKSEGIIMNGAKVIMTKEAQ